MSQTNPERWGIVGGGLLGMTLAHRLARLGKAVTLFEAADHLGGLASAWRLGDVVWDRHYHVILLSDRHLLAVLEELGLANEMEWVETRTGFYTDGQLFSMSNTWEFLRFPPLRLWDKLRLGATIFYASRIKDWHRLEKVPVADWLRRWSGRRTFERIWLPLLRAKLGENYRKASAAFIWAIIARMYAARRTGLKKEMFGYVRGGYAHILDRFAQVLADDKVEVRLQHRAGRVRSADGEVEIEFDNGRRESFDRVVLTQPSALAARLCQGLSEEERSRLEAIQYQGIVCASVLLEKAFSGLLRHEYHGIVGPVYRGHRDVGAGGPQVFWRQRARLLAQVRHAGRSVLRSFRRGNQGTVPRGAGEDVSELRSKRRARLPSVTRPARACHLDVELFGEPAPDGDVAAGRLHREFRPHRQRHSQRQRNRAAGRKRHRASADLAR